MVWRRNSLLGIGILVYHSWMDTFRGCKGIHNADDTYYPRRFQSCHHVGRERRYCLGEVQTVIQEETESESKMKTFYRILFWAIALIALIAFWTWVFWMYAQ